MLEHYICNIKFSIVLSNLWIYVLL